MRLRPPALPLRARSSGLDFDFYTKTCALCIEGARFCILLHQPLSSSQLNRFQGYCSGSGRVVDLTAKEYDLLEVLMKNPRRVFSREKLMDQVWGYTYAGDYRTVDVHIRRLREKLEPDPAQPQYILTKWGVGYYFQDEK